ncbi:metallophosphoesterase [Paenibacillus vulneris]|uniref:Metallophosphoesterase family protein n=1 Tax=Paenibacillus vulneris TaxID=1133364 RepID=A0ABW3UFI6_9BACL
MPRTLCISDIHGCYDEFNKLLNEVGYSPYDQLILLGDYEDRGFKSKEVIEQVKTLVDKNGVVALRGNHDQMFLDIFNGGDDYLFLHNGGIHTIESYCGMNWFEQYDGFEFNRYLQAKEFIKKNYSEHIEFLESLPYYYEDDLHIYVHAGINPFYEDWTKQPKDDFIWIRDIFLNNKIDTHKKVIFGHTPTINMNGNSAEVWFQDDKIGIDGGCCFGYQLNCLEIIDGHYNTYSIDSSLKSDKN